MPLRVLQHGSAGATESVGLEAGKWTDVAVHGQFLLDLEFLLRCAPTSGTSSCVYCKSPSYLREIAQHFPWIHFYTFEHAHAVPEYDPAQPSLTHAVPLTVQVDFNKTMSSQEFTKDMARAMGERSARERQSLLMICHGLDTVRQLVLQVLMRPNYALLDVCGIIPVDYLDGDLILPLYLPNNKIYVGLVAQQDAKSREYDPGVFVGEIGKAGCARPSWFLPLTKRRLFSGRDPFHARVRRLQQGHHRQRLRPLHAQISRMLTRGGEARPAQHRGPALGRTRTAPGCMMTD